MSGPNWMIAHWMRDGRPLLVFLAVQVIGALFVFDGDHGAIELWVANLTGETSVTRNVLLLTAVPGLILAGVLAQRDRSKHEQFLAPASAGENWRRLSARALAVCVLTIVAQTGVALFARSFHGLSYVADTARAFEVLAFGWSGLVAFVLLSALFLLPVPFFAAVQLFVLVAFLGAWWAWLVIPLLMAWTLYGGSHDPDTPPRVRRGGPAVAALALFIVSVDGCSHRAFDEQRDASVAARGISSSRMEEMLPEGAVANTSVERPGTQPDPAIGRRLSSRAATARPALNQSESPMVCRFSSAGGLEAVYRDKRRHLTTASIELRGESRFGEEARVLPLLGSAARFVAFEPGRRTWLFLRPGGSDERPLVAERVELPDGDQIVSVTQRREYGGPWPYEVPYPESAEDRDRFLRIEGRAAAYTWEFGVGWRVGETSPRPTLRLEWGPMTTRQATVLVHGAEEHLTSFEIGLDEPDQQMAIPSLLRPTPMPLLALAFDQGTIPWVDPWVRASRGRIFFHLFVTGCALVLVDFLLDPRWAPVQHRRFWLIGVLVGGPLVALLCYVFEDGRAHRESPTGTRRSPRLRLRASATTITGEVLS